MRRLAAAPRRPRPPAAAARRRPPRHATRLKAGGAKRDDDGGAAASFLSSPYDAPILALAAPTVVALAADPLLSLADTAFAAPLGPAALAALGVNTAIFTLALFLFNFLSSATTPLVAGALARGDDAAARVG